MPFELNWEPRGIYRRYYGRVTGDDLVESTVQTQADPRFDGLRYSLSDFSGLETLAVREDQLAHVAAVVHGAFHSNPNMNVALVITKPELLETVERFMTLGGTPYGLQVFVSLTAARLTLMHDDGRRQLLDRPR